MSGEILPTEAGHAPSRSSAIRWYTRMGPTGLTYSHWPREEESPDRDVRASDWLGHDDPRPKPAIRTSIAGRQSDPNLSRCTSSMVDVFWMPRSISHSASILFLFASYCHAITLSLQFFAGASFIAVEVASRGVGLLSRHR